MTIFEGKGNVPPRGWLSRIIDILSLPRDGDSVPTHKEVTEIPELIAR